MPLTNESLLTHIMKIRDLLFELDKEKERSIGEVRDIMLQLQGEFAAFGVTVSSLVDTVNSIESVELAKYSKLIYDLNAKVSDLETKFAVEAVRQESGAGKAVVELQKADQDNRHELRMQILKIVGSGGAGAAIVKLLDWLGS